MSKLFLRDKLGEFRELTPRGPVVIDFAEIEVRTLAHVATLKSDAIMRAASVTAERDCEIADAAIRLSIDAGIDSKLLRLLLDTHEDDGAPCANRRERRKAAALSRRKGKHNAYNGARWYPY